LVIDFSIDIFRLPQNKGCANHEDGYENLFHNGFIYGLVDEFTY
jgi:hypothetical protein